MQTTSAPSDPAMDVCSSPGGVSASARQPPAQNDAEAQPKEAAGVGPARRVGAAVRLVLDGITESAQALETPTESMEGVVSPSDGEGHIKKTAPGLLGRLGPNSTSLQDTSTCTLYLY